MDTSKEIYEICRRVLLDEEFSAVAKIYRERLEKFQIMRSTFTAEQAKVVDDYLDIREVMREIMMKIALKDPNPQSRYMMEWLYRDV